MRVLGLKSDNSNCDPWASHITRVSHKVVMSIQRAVNTICTLERNVSLSCHHVGGIPTLGEPLHEVN